MSNTSKTTFKTNQKQVHIYSAGIKGCLDLAQHIRYIEEKDQGRN